MSIAPVAPDLLCAALLKVRARVSGLLPAFWGTLVQGAWCPVVGESCPEAASVEAHGAVLTKRGVCPLGASIAAPGFPAK